MTVQAPAVFTDADFEGAIRLLLPALRGYAHNLTRDRSRSEDLVQETLLRAWAARHRFIPNTNLKAWLFRIEHNCFVSLWRKSRRFAHLDPELLEARLTAPAAQEEGLMMRDLALAVTALPTHQAVALAMINDEGLQYDEAAARLGIAVGTMKSRTTRARTAVKQFLSGDAGGSPTPAQRLAKAAKPTPALAPPPPRAPAPALIEPAVNSRYAAWKASGQRTIG